MVIGYPKRLRYHGGGVCRNRGREIYKFCGNRSECAICIIGFTGVDFGGSPGKSPQ